MKRFLILSAALLAGSLAHAQEIRRAEPVTPQVAASSDNEMAKFLAGVPLPDTSALAPLQKTSRYQGHINSLAKLSQHYDRNYFSKMRAWSAAELAPRVPMTQPVFYFFGGPDAVSPLAFFPDAPVYVLGGLEPVGSIAAPQTLTEEALHEGLVNLRKSTEVILSYGHFITKDMKAELDRTAFRGVLPVIYTFLSLTGAEVVSTTFVSIRPNATLAEGDGAGGLPGVRITFRKAPGAGLQTLYYFQANVADDAIKSNGALLKWAESIGKGNVYLKAASYLLHEAYFSRIRTFLLTNATSVLQDDSGIPFRFFRDGGWRIWLFGHYSGTLDIFKSYYQTDLQAAFATPDTVMPLPFGTGYKWRHGESNLLLAVRQEAPRALPAGQ